SWHNAVQFCQTLNELPEEKNNKRLYRLPTEAEWEYACRGGSPTYQVFHYGNKLTHAEANFNTSEPYNSAERTKRLDRPVPVDDPNYKPNAFGLYHMYDNVSEWCDDWCDGQYYEVCARQRPCRDPLGPPGSKNDRRVVRGGSYSSQ